MKNKYRLEQHARRRFNDDVRRGGSPRESDHIAKQKIPVFMSLYEKIVQHHGTREKAHKAIGYNSSSLKYRAVNDGVLTAYAARLILDEYNRIKAS